MHKLFLCLRYLRQKRIAFFGTGAVALCVALLIVITSLFNGFIDSFRQHTKSYLGDVSIQLWQGISDFTELAQYLETFDGVATAQGRVYIMGLLYLGRGDVRGVGLTGIDLERQSRDERFRKGLLLQGASERAPSFALSPAQKQRARDWMEKKLRRKVTDEELPVGAIVGIGVIAKPDELTDEYDHQEIIQELQQRSEPMVITIGQRGESGSGKIARKKKMLCWPIDVVQVGDYSIDFNSVYLPLEYVKELKGWRGSDGKVRSSGSISITGAPFYDINTVRAQVEQGWYQYAREKLHWPLEKIANVRIEETAQSPHVLRFTSEIRKQLAVMQVMLGLICVVVALLIFVIMLMIVMQKKKDIGIVRALGAGRRGVAGMFLWYGGGIGVAGTSIGLVLGILATHNISLIESCLTKILGFKIWKSSVYMFSQIPNEVDWWATVWIIVTGIAIAIIGATLPAWRAARLEPVEALRYE